jgi:hypothetical protein
LNQGIQAGKSALQHRKNILIVRPEDNAAETIHLGGIAGVTALTQGLAKQQKENSGVKE